LGLAFQAISSRAEAQTTVRNTDSGSWKTVMASISGFALGGSQLVLCYDKGSDTVFHMVEVDRLIEEHMNSFPFINISIKSQFVVNSQNPMIL
jgi:hypothetical protein